MTENRATVHLEAGPLASRESGGTELPDTPFEVVLLGDFSGRDSRGDRRSSLADLQSIQIDRDDFDAVLARVAPRIRVSLGDASPPMEIAIQELDDFHPDFLFDRAPLFAELRRLRRRAGDPGELRSLSAELGMAEPERSTASAPAAGGGGVLDQILELSQPVSAAPSLSEITKTGGLDQVVRRLVAPHLVPREDPRQAEIIDSIDAAVAAGMRLLLHHPGFQSVEALWRALYGMVRRVETGPLLHIRIVDVSRAELQLDLDGAESGGGQLRRLLRGEPAADARPALLVAAYQFGEIADDLRCLRQLAALGEELDAPCLAGAAPALIGSPDAAALAEPELWGDPSPGWDELRGLPAARFLGLAMPRYLVRTPYGEEGEECERFAFEELSTPPRHEEFLWANPALVCASLLAESFAGAGWQMRPGMNRDLDGLPLPLIRTDGEVRVHPTTESWLTETGADRLLDAGVMPLAPIRDRDVARVVRFQSIAAPLAPLAGRWTHA